MPLNKETKPNLLLLFTPWEFFTSVLVDGLSQEFQWQQVSPRTLLSILAVPKNVVVCMVSTRPPTSKSSSPFNNPLVTVPKEPFTIGIIVTFMFHIFFISLKRSTYSFHFPSVLFKIHNFASSLFLLIIVRSGLLAKIKWSIWVSKSHRSLCLSFSRTDAGLCIYHLFVWSNLNFLHITQWITLPTQSCLVLYSLQC